MSLTKCPCQENCVHYESNGRMPPNNDVRNKQVCSRYVKMCEMAMFYEREVMGMVIACPIKPKGER